MSAAHCDHCTSLAWCGRLDESTTQACMADAEHPGPHLWNRLGGSHLYPPTPARLADLR